MMEQDAMADVSQTVDGLPDSNGRVKGVTIIKPIIVGNVAKNFGKKREEDGHTHSWTVYLRPLPNEDYSSFIKKVHFKLHDSYANPNRIVTKPPYEISETGWGEFEVVIRIHFNDPTERPVTIYHILKLFQPGADPTIATKKQLVTENYDEIIFQEPTLLMKSFLDDVIPLTATPWKHDIDVEEKRSLSLAQINPAKSKIKNEIQDLKNKLKIAHETIEKFKEAVQNTKHDSGIAGPATTQHQAHLSGSEKLLLPPIDPPMDIKVEDS